MLTAPRADVTWLVDLPLKMLLAFTPLSSKCWSCPLPVHPNCLISKAGIGVGGVQQIGAESGAQDGELSKASRPEGRISLTITGTKS
jgi:hypothetical protein